MGMLRHPEKNGKLRAMKIKTILLGAALAATVPTLAAQSHFVLFDSLLRVPALCYPLPPGWAGMGWIKWNVPVMASVMDFDRFLTVSPPGKLAETKKIGGRLLARAYENRLWRHAANRMMLAILKGQMIGMNEGMELMRQSRAENERTMDRSERAHV